MVELPNNLQPDGRLSGDDGGAIVREDELNAPLRFLRHALRLRLGIPEPRAVHGHSRAEMLDGCSAGERRTLRHHDVDLYI